MRDIQLNALRENFARMSVPTLAESHVPLRENKVYLPETKKRFPHLTESFLLENKTLMENINFFKVTVKEIQNSFQGLKFAEARAIQKAMIQFAIMEHHARNTSDESEMATKIEESSKLILELQDEAKFDPEKTLKPDPNFNPEATIGRGDYGKIAYPEVPDAPKKEKKGFLKTVKEFLVKAGEYIKQIITSKNTWKAVAIGAAMVILGVIAGAIGGWAAVGFAALKGVLGAVSIFKGSKELIKSKDFAQGKKGVEGVKQWIKSAKEPANAAKVIIGLAQVALGAWGASSAVGQVMVEIKKMAASATFNPSGGADIKPSAKPEAPIAKPDAPAQAAPAPEVKPDAPVVPPQDPSQVMRKMGGLVGQNYEQYLADPEKYNNKILGYLSKMGVNPDSPATEVFKGLRGNMTVREYVEMTLDGVAKAKQMAAMAAAR
jgi:hypothetical protein